MKDFILNGTWFWIIPNWVQFLVIAFIAYMVGCFSVARFIARLKNQDISKLGSGNPGAMNMIRHFGVAIGVLTFMLDALKAGLPAIIVYCCYNVGNYGGGTVSGFVFESTQFPVGVFAALLCGMCVMLGHIYPVTTGFKGGKGISSSVGLFWIMLGMANPWFWLVGFVIVLTWPLTISLTKVGSLCTLSYLAGFGVWQIGTLFHAFGTGNVWVSFCVAFVFLTVSFSWLAHYKNMRCLLSGEEHQTVMIKFKKKAKREKSV